jgi:DNA-binding LacI/PurR family transcriptional regulator
MGVTLQTIADHIGVSRMTVSNAFSRPDQLSEALRERILTVADDLGYCGPDPVARSLSSGRTGTVGVLVTDTLTYAFTDRVATMFLSGAASVLEPHGAGLTVLSSPRGGDAGAITRAVVDALLVYSVDAESPGLQVARRRGFPLVLTDQAPEQGVPSVNVDDRGGARAAAEHLRRLGHRQVALLTESLGDDPSLVDPHTRAGHFVVAERHAGWFEGLATDVVSPMATIRVNDRDQARSATGLLLDSHPGTTAVLALTDAMALGVIDAAVDRGLRVPEDLSVVGFDDAPADERHGPILTTIRQPLREKGVAAARLVLDLLDGTGPDPAPHVQLPTELVVRDSTAPPTTRPRRSS